MGWGLGLKRGLNSLHLRIIHLVCTIFTKPSTLMKARNLFHNHIGKYLMKRPTTKLQVFVKSQSWMGNHGSRLILLSIILILPLTICLIRFFCIWLIQWLLLNVPFENFQSDRDITNVWKEHKFYACRHLRPFIFAVPKPMLTQDLGACFIRKSLYIYFQFWRGKMK